MTPEETVGVCKLEEENAALKARDDWTGRNGEPWKAADDCAQRIRALKKPNRGA